MTDAVKRAKELLDQLPPGPWAVEGTSASRANVVDAKGNWIADIRKDFSEDDQPSLIELRNEVLPALVAEVERLNKALTEAEIDTHDARGKVADQDERIAELHRQREEALAEVERYRSAVLPEKVAEIDGRYRELAERIANARKIMDCDASDREGQLRARDAIQFVFSKETTAYCDCVTLLDAVHALTVNAGLSAIRIRQLREQLASCEKALEDREASLERMANELADAHLEIGRLTSAQIPEWRAIGVLTTEVAQRHDRWAIKDTDGHIRIRLLRTSHKYAYDKKDGTLILEDGSVCRPVDSEGVPVPWDRVGL